MKVLADWGTRYLTSAERVKEAVSGWAWACGMWSVEEIGNLCDGRLDLLLIPIGMDSPIFKQLKGHWTDRLGLVGVEVKVDRADFKKGLESGQLDRYAKDLSGLYVAGPPDVVDRKVVPEQYGVLHIGARRGMKENSPVVCRRHAKFKRSQLTEEQHWRIIWAMAKSIGRFTREQREQAENLERRIKAHASKAIWSAIKSVVDLEGAEQP